MYSSIHLLSVVNDMVQMWLFPSVPSSFPKHVEFILSTYHAVVIDLFLHFIVLAPNTSNQTQPFARLLSAIKFVLQAFQ